MKIACTHSGLNGDALYSLPTIRHISKIFDTKVDFWTSKLCTPILSLVKAQSYINEVFVAEKYQVQHTGCGAQPFQLEPEKSYDKVYMLGFRDYPQCRLVDYFPSIYGFSYVDTTIKYEGFQEKSKDNSIVICPGRNPQLKPVFIELMSVLSQKGNIVNQIGPENETIKLDLPNLTTYNVDMLETLGFLADAKLFVGTLSANLVLANGFPNLKKVVLVEPERHNPTHDIHSPNHFYIKPEEALTAIKAASVITRSPID